jgi:hypothetical protein
VPEYFRLKDGTSKSFEGFGAYFLGRPIYDLSPFNGRSHLASA